VLRGCPLLWLEARGKAGHNDALPPVDIPFMLGPWRGETYPSGHPLDGSLKAFHWHGKRFDSAEEVHPLVFSNLAGDLVCLDPRWVGPGLKLSDRFPVPRSTVLGRLFQLLLPLVSTKASGARLRMTSYRSVVSAAMLYDHLPIIDVFRRLDDDTVLGVMDRKGMATPFFFVLRRDSPTPSHSVTIK